MKNVSKLLIVPTLMFALLVFFSSNHVTTAEYHYSEEMIATAI